MQGRPHPALLIALFAVLAVGALTVVGSGPFGGEAPESAFGGAVAPTTVGAAGAPAGPGATASSGATSPIAKAIGAEHLPAFERVNVKLINLSGAIHDPIGPLTAEAHRACARLDRSVPLLRAEYARCDDTIVVAKMMRVLGERCGGATGANPKCARAADRIAEALAGLASASRAYAPVLRRSVEPGACRRALMPTHDEVSTTEMLARRLRGIAQAARARDPHALAVAGAALDAAANVGDIDGRPPQVRADELRAACQLPRTPDPAG